MRLTNENILRLRRAAPQCFGQIGRKAEPFDRRVQDPGARQRQPILRQIGLQRSRADFVMTNIENDFHSTHVS